MMIESHPLDNAQGSRYRFVMASVVLLLTFSIGLSWFAVAPITPLIMAEFNISRGTTSLLVSLVAMTGLISGIPGGVMINRIGAKKAIIVGAVLASLPALSFLAEDYFLLLLTKSKFPEGLYVHLTKVASVSLLLLVSLNITPLFNCPFFIPIEGLSTVKSLITRPSSATP